MTIELFLLLLACYLFGAIPSAYLVSQFVGEKEIWRLGDGNIGAKNTFISVGKLEGLLVGAVDMLKGALSIELVRYFHQPDWAAYLAGALAVMGHDFSVFVGFRGGQGMATMVGAFWMIVPLQTAVGFIIFVLSLVVTRHWNLSCLLGFGSFTGLVWITGGPAWYPVVLLPTIGFKKIMQNLRSRHAVA